VAAVVAVDIAAEVAIVFAGGVESVIVIVEVGVVTKAGPGGGRFGFSCELSASGHKFT
jgi:hypothetical protein